MTIAHIALWTTRLEELRDFYLRNFGGTSSDKYTNPAKGFESYFITFDTGCGLELMRRQDISQKIGTPHTGLCHLAFTCASPEEVDLRTARMRAGGCRITGEPRVTGDGYYESVVEDPDGNPIELVHKL